MQKNSLTVEISLPRKENKTPLQNRQRIEGEKK